MPDNDDKTSSQLARPTAPSISLLATEIRKVLRCPHCCLVQFQTRNAMCRRCHQPLNEREQLCVSPDPAPPAAAAAQNALVSQLGIRVRELRRRRGLSQGEFAERMKVPRTYISKIERCRSVPTLQSLCRIASALGIEVYHLLSNAWLEECDVEAIVQDHFVNEMAQFVAKLNPQQRAVILESLAQGLHRGL